MPVLLACRRALFLQFWLVQNGLRNPALSWPCFDVTHRRTGELIPFCRLEGGR
jgi:hypothetical protein